MEGTVFIFSWLVDFLLLMGVSQLYPHRGHFIKAIIAAAMNGIYVALASRRVFPFMDTPILAGAAMVITGMIAFGCSAKGIRSCGMFLLLRLAMTGITQPVLIFRPLPLLLASSLALLLCVMGLPEKNDHMIPVELSYGTNRMTITALRDTGNGLQDPLTGKPVLILGADAAQSLTGLTAQQLRKPVETMGALPGLRLIPYRSIGGEGLLLALRLHEMRVGSRSGSGIVAFAPEILSKEGKFQALTGGTL